MKCPISGGEIIITEERGHALELPGQLLTVSDIS